MTERNERFSEWLLKQAAPNPSSSELEMAMAYERSANREMLEQLVRALEEMRWEIHRLANAVARIDGQICVLTGGQNGSKSE